MTCRFFRRSMALAAGFTLVLMAGCASRASVPPGADRDGVITRIAAATAKIVIEREGRRVASASGVVVLAGREGAGQTPVSYVLTARHAVEGKGDVVLFVRLTGEYAAKGKLRAELYGADDGSDVALLRVPGVALVPAVLAEPPDARLGEAILVSGFPWGKRLALFAGIVSQLPEGGNGSAEDGGGETTLVVDAAAANGVSGGGVFREATGVLLGVVEGFQTASIAVEGRARTYSVKVPLPGETFVVPADRIREFLRTAAPDLAPL